jgi:hypothetical protein
LCYPRVDSLACSFIPAIKAAQSNTRWSKIAREKFFSLDFSKLDYIFILINHNNAHWALGLVSCKDKTMNYYESWKWDDGGIFYGITGSLFPLSLCPKEIIGKYNVVLIYPIKKFL